MKTSLFLLLAAFPYCLAFQQAVSSSVRQQRARTFVVTSAGSSSTAVEEKPPVIKQQSTSELPPVLQSIVDERAEFQMNLGKAMDTLRKDYPDILKKSPGTESSDESLVICSFGSTTAPLSFTVFLSVLLCTILYHTWYRFQYLS